MSEPVRISHKSESDDCVENSLTDRNNQHDSEYDTASDTGSDGGENDYEDDDEDDVQVVDSDNDDTGNITLDLERQRGDGQEQEVENKKKVDDDEDRSNPQYIPKKGTFYEHDDRTADDPEAEKVIVEEEGTASEKLPSSAAVTPVISKAKKWQATSGADRWSHDRYDENEQAPKSRAELVSAYGYDIRSEEGPPRARRRRRYGRGPNKYTRKWEDETAYGKTSTQRRAAPLPEDFPVLGSRISKKTVLSDETTKENNPSDCDTGRKSLGRSVNYSENATPTNSRSQSFVSKDKRVKGRISGYRVGRNTIEFKNQNRNKKNDSSPPLSGSNSLHVVNKINNNMQQSIQQHIKSTDSIPIEGLSFTNTNLMKNETDDRYTNGNEISQGDTSKSIRTSKEREWSNNISRSQQPQRLPNSSSLNNVEIPFPSIVSQQSPQLHPSVAAINDSSVVNVTNEITRPKRYSSLRQRSGNETLQSHSLPPTQKLPLHEMQQTELLQKNLIQHMQQQNNPDNIKLAAQNQTKTKYQTPSSPSVHLSSGQGQSSQQIVSQIAQQPGNSTQYPANYFPTNEYLNSTVSTPQATNQPNQNQQIITGQPYPSQFSQTSGPYIQAPPPAAFLPSQTNPQAQIMNYVPAIAPTQTQFQTFPGYQNFSNVPSANVIHQTQGGITYYAPQTQPPPRPVLSQRRPNNAIPILAPPERGGKGRGRLANPQMEEYEEHENNKSSTVLIDSVENIDHILDNMFVQRPPYQPPTVKTPLSIVDGSSTVPVVATQQQKMVDSSEIFNDSSIDSRSSSLEQVENALQKLAVNEVESFENADERINLVSKIGATEISAQTNEEKSECG